VDLGIVLPGRRNGETSSFNGDSPCVGAPRSIVWQPVDRTPDGFKVEMPAEIKQIQVPAYNEQGGSEQVDMIYSYPDSETCFSVAWADDPPVERVNSDVFPIAPWTWRGTTRWSARKPRWSTSPRSASRAFRDGIFQHATWAAG
jgi:hypothetical protein